MSIAPHSRPQLTHVARPCRDIDATVAFYRDFVGLHVVHEREDEGVRVKVGKRAGQKSDGHSSLQ